MLLQTNVDGDRRPKKQRVSCNDATRSKLTRRFSIAPALALEFELFPCLLEGICAVTLAHLDPLGQDSLQRTRVAQRERAAADAPFFRLLGAQWPAKFRRRLEAALG